MSVTVWPLDTISADVNVACSAKTLNLESKSRATKVQESQWEETRPADPIGNRFFSRFRSVTHRFQYTESKDFLYNGKAYRQTLDH